MKRFEYYFKKSAITLLRVLNNLSQKIESHKMILRKIPGSKKMRPIVNRYKLTFAITGAIIVCLILTSFSVLLYTVTGTAKLDLSRPGYEEVRRKVNNVPSNENSFSPNGTLDETIINEYIKKYKKQSGAINKYDTFNPHLLDDVPLGLSATQVAPSDGANQSP